MIEVTCRTSSRTRKTSCNKFSVGRRLFTKEPRRCQSLGQTCSWSGAWPYKAQTQIHASFCFYSISLKQPQVKQGADGGSRVHLVRYYLVQTILAFLKIVGVLASAFNSSLISYTRGFEGENDQTPKSWSHCIAFLGREPSVQRWPNESVKALCPTMSWENANCSLWFAGRSSYHKEHFPLQNRGSKRACWWNGWPDWA